MFGDAYQADVDAALDLRTADRSTADPLPQAPRPLNAWRAATAAPRGVGAAANESAGFLADVLGAFGQVSAGTDARSGGMFSLSTDEEARQQEQARQKMLKQGIDFTSEAGEDFRSVAREWMPDPLTAHWSEQTVFSLSRFATKAVGYTMTGGAIPGAALVAADEGMTTASDLKAQGVDEATRTKVGALTGVTSAAGVLLPVAGKTTLQTLGLVVAGGPLSFIAQQQATRTILDRAGYDNLAEQYDPFDPVGLAVSTLVPAGFGAWASRGAARRAKIKVSDGPAEVAPAMASTAREPAAAVNEPVAPQPSREQVDAARVHLLTEQIESARLTPPDDLAAAAAHTEAVGRAMDQMARGERVEVADVAPVPRVPPVETPEFKAWFGDSKIVDAEGRPVVMYHGTRSDIAGFDPARLGESTGADSAGLGFFFTNKVSGERHGWMASGAEVWAAGRDGSYAGGGNVVPAYLAVRNPYEATAADMGRAHSDSAAAAALRSRLESQGFDGIKFRDADEEWVIAFRPEQIKSAIGNTGRFDAASGSLTDSPFATWAEQIRAAIEEMRAAADKETTPRAQRQPAEQAAPAARDQAPAAEGGEGAAGQAAAPAEPGGAGADLQAAGVKPEAAEAQAVAARLDEIRQQFPDLRVQLDGMDAPMRLSDFLEAAQREADEMRADAPDFEVAANCFLLNGG